MTRILSSVLAIGATMFTLAGAPAAHGATFTFSDPNCASMGLTDNGGGNYVLTCQALSCSIAVAPGNPLPTDAVTLTANCAPIATGTTTYTWSNLSGPETCPAVSSSSNTAGLTAAGSVLSGCVYKVVAANTLNGGGSASTSVSWGAPQAPTGCVPTITPSTLTSAGGNVSLNVTGCSPSSGLTYSWTKGGIAIGTTQSLTSGNSGNFGTTAITQSYQVTVCNGAVCTSPLPSTPMTVTIAGTGGTGGGGGGTTPPPTGGTISCSGYNNTKVIDAQFPANGGANLRYFTSLLLTNGFGAADALVVRFTTPPSDAYLFLTMSESGGTSGQPANRTISLSKVACDFAVPKSVNSAWAYQDSGMALTLSSSISSASARYRLDGSTQYFLNVTNFMNGQQQCGTSRCDVFFTFSNPTP